MKTLLPSSKHLRLFVVICASVAAKTAAAAHPGDLDPTFGAGGTVTTSFRGSQEDWFPHAALQADGKLVVVGATGGSIGFQNLALARYNTDGSLDPTFGTNGKVVAELQNVAPWAIAAQSDGKIVVAAALGVGTANSDFGLLRYNADGTLDTTFGAGGQVNTDFRGGADTPASVAVQADGRIVVAGSTQDPSSSPNYVTSADFALARYNADGSLDPSFGTGGRVTTDFASRIDRGQSMVLQSDGKILVGGVAHDVTDVRQLIAFARYNADGTLDATFGTGGQVLGPEGSLEAMVVQADGRIVAAGNFLDPTTRTYQSLAAYNPDGSVVPEFGGDGPSGIGGKALALQTDGKIVMAGIDSTFEFVFARFTSDGRLDPSYGNGGLTIVPVGQYGTPRSVLIQGGGRVVAVGEALQPLTGYDFVLVACDANGNLDATFGTKGKVTTDFLGPATDVAYDVAIQPNGAIVVLGMSQHTGADLAVARYNPDGTLDATFGSGGRITTAPLQAGYWQAGRLALQSDGKIVLAASLLASLSEHYHFAVVRLGLDGSFDPTWGGRGYVVTDFGKDSVDIVTGLAVQADGKVIVAGTAATTSSSLALARYNSDGTLDTAFGTAGTTTTRFNTGDVAATGGLALQGDGRILVGGVLAGVSNSFAVARYNSDGSPDTGFGSSGLASRDMGNGFPTAIALQRDGRIVAVGVSPLNGSGFALVRFTGNGTLDSGFGTAGVVTTTFPEGPASPFGVAVQPSGRIVVGGLVVLESASEVAFGLARYGVDGTLDASFGAQGRVTTSLPGKTIAVIRGLAIQSDANIVAVGEARAAEEPSDFAVARYDGGAGSRIAFASGRSGNGDIYVMDGAGNGAVVVASDPAVDFAPALSPDGTKVAFVSTRTGNGDIYVADVNAPDAAPIRLAGDPASDFGPVWSPMGDKIAFVSARSGNGDIYVVNADGTGLKNISNHPAPDFNPSFSPDGSKLVFTSMRSGNGDLYLVDLRDPTLAAVRLTDSPWPDLDPVFSPDGKTIAFVRGSGAGDIYLLDMATRSVTPLATSAATDSSPVFSPDGSRVAFVSTRSGDSDVWVVNVDGTGLRNVTKSPAQDFAPVFSPDGTQLAFVSNRDGNLEIYAVRVDGTLGPTNLTRNPALDAEPSWR